MRSMAPGSQDRVALITGSAKGLGQVLALKLAERGVSIALLDLDAKGVSGTARQVRSYGVRCCEITANLTDLGAAGEAVQRTLTELGQLDVLVNNAGTASVATLLNVTVQEWDKVFAVNVRGTLT